jgi:hypothetical protein
MVRLNNDNYNRPKKTYQENLDEKQIKEKLQNYTLVKNIVDVPINSHLRYFSYKEDPKTKKVEKLFRMGGILKNKDKVEDYVVLSNGTKSWSVNTKKSTFFKKMTVEEVQEKYSGRIKELEGQIKKLQKKLEVYKQK